MFILVSITLAYIFIIMLLKLAEIKHNNEIQKLRSSKYYVQLKNLLEDCTIVNSVFYIMRLEITKANAEGFYNFSIRFNDLGAHVIEPQRHALEIVEQQAKAFYQSEIERLKGHNLLTAVKIASDKTYDFRLNIQKGSDSSFFTQLFNGRSFSSREFFITSPFENYASSNGTYIFDPDDWKIVGDDAIFMGMLEFDRDYQKVVPYLIKGTVEKMFPNVKVTIFSNGCFVNNLC